MIKSSDLASIRESDIDFRKLVHNSDQAEITKKIKTKESSKLQYISNIQGADNSFSN